jgi:hypothetical protein
MQAFLSSLIKRLIAPKSITNVFLSCQSFPGKSWDIVGMGFSKVPKVLGDERLVPNPLGVNEWCSEKMDSFFPEGITLMASTVLVNCLPLAHE